VTVSIVEELVLVLVSDGAVLVVVLKFWCCFHNCLLVLVLPEVTQQLSAVLKSNVKTTPQATCSAGSNQKIAQLASSPRPVMSSPTRNIVSPPNVMNPRTPARPAASTDDSDESITEIQEKFRVSQHAIAVACSFYN